MAYTNLASFELNFDRFSVLDGGSVVVGFRSGDVFLNMHYKSLDGALTALRTAINDITVYLQGEEEQ